MQKIHLAEQHRCEQVLDRYLPHCISPPVSRRPGRPLREQAFTERPRQAAAPSWLQENMGRHNGPPFICVAGGRGNNKQQGGAGGSPDCWGATMGEPEACTSSSLPSDSSLRLLHNIEFACKLHATSGFHPGSSLPKTCVPRGSYRKQKIRSLVRRECPFPPFSGISKL